MIRRNFFKDKNGQNSWSHHVNLRCLYYVSLGIWIFVFDVLSGTPRSLDHIFQYQVCVFFQNIILTNLQSFV